MNRHTFELETIWVGNQGTGTSDYRAYSRAHVIRAEGKHEILGSSDKAFHGDVSRWNPEELLIAALSQCHMLSFLHVAQAAVSWWNSYEDQASGVLTRHAGWFWPDHRGHPSAHIEISGGDATAVPDLHHRASQLCFIANSVNFPVHHEPLTRVRSSD
jgi:organic hydroperoxide reductase OsmC/OhrA